MNPTRLVPAVVLGLAPLAVTACEHNAIECDTYETPSRVDCVDGPTGDIVVRFDSDLSCPTEDSCTIDFRKQNDHNGYWVITKDEG